jgi:hypothetical protein
LAVNESAAAKPIAKRAVRVKANPLSPFTYLYRNAGKTIPLTGVIMLAVLLVTGVIALIDSIPESIRSIYSYSNKMTGISPRGDASETPKLLAEIKKDSPIPLERVVSCRASASIVNSIVGKWPFIMLGLSRSDMIFYLNRMHTTHIEGRLPAPGAAEALVSRPVAKNLHLRIFNPKDPWILRSKSVVLGPDKSDSYSPNFVKVVGIADTDQWLMVNSIEYQRLYHFPPIDLGLVFAKTPSDQSRLDHWAAKHFKGRNAQVFAYFMIEKQTNEMFGTLYELLDVVIGILAGVMTFMMAMLMNIYQSQRLVEFGLLHAIGYTRWQLLKRVFWESALVVFLGWFLGIMGAQLMLKILNQIIMAPRAFDLPSFDYTAFKYTEPLPFAILIVAGATVWWRFHRFDSVSIVERRLV